MKDEIKEILDRAIKLKDKCSCCEQIGNGVYISKYHEIETQNLAEAVYIINRLLDYITNLQDTLKDREEYCYGLETSLTNLEEENDRLKDELKRLHNLLNSQAYQDLDKYKSRNEKAIEYLREIEMFEKKFGFDGVRRKKLLNILQGEDKDD